jgi:hypothetical protein
MPRFARKSFDNVVEEPMYDDGWLRDYLKLMNDKIDRHVERDEASHARVLGEIEELKDGMRMFVGLSHALKWIAVAIGGAGGIFAAIKMVLGWTGKS